MKKFNLENRLAEIKANNKIINRGTMFIVQFNDSYFSDSTVASGEWVDYWADDKKYKSLKGAINRLVKVVKVVKMNLPADTEISDEFINSMVMAE